MYYINLSYTCVYNSIILYIKYRNVLFWHLIIVTRHEYHDYIGQIWKIIYWKYMLHEETTKICIWPIVQLIILFITHDIRVINESIFSILYTNFPLSVHLE